MKTILGLILIFISFSRSDDFRNKLLKDKRFCGGVEYGRKLKIEPKFYEFGDYLFVTGFTNRSSSMGMFYQQKQIRFDSAIDSALDNVFQRKLNNDTIPDFIYKKIYEDNTEIYALISVTRTKFIDRQIYNGENGRICLGNGLPNDYDVTKELIFKDINSDGNVEILVNHLRIKGKIKALGCSDTFYVNKK